MYTAAKNEDADHRHIRRGDHARYRLEHLRDGDQEQIEAEKNEKPAGELTYPECHNTPHDRATSCATAVSAVYITGNRYFTRLTQPWHTHLVSLPSTSCHNLRVFTAGLELCPAQPAADATLFAASIVPHNVLQRDGGR